MRVTRVRFASQFASQSMRFRHSFSLPALAMHSPRARRNSELPVDWNGATCAGTSNGVSCDTADGRALQ
jgi:hypothetical protein